MRTFTTLALPRLAFSGVPALRRPIYCTMKGYRALDLGGSAALSAVCRHIKLARSGDLHDAIEDAWLATVDMAVSLKAAIDVKIFARHPPRREPLLEAAPNGAAREPR
jgi:hypothetical protein